MKTNKVLIDGTLRNRGIESKDCKFCVYSLENGCPSDQSHCWRCKDKLEFKPVSCLDGLETQKFKVFSSSLLPFGKDYSKIQRLLLVQADLSIAICYCSDKSVLHPLCRAYKSLSEYVKDVL